MMGTITFGRSTTTQATSLGTFPAAGPCAGGPSHPCPADARVVDVPPPIEESPRPSATIALVCIGMICLFGTVVAIGLSR